MNTVEKRIARQGGEIIEPSLSVLTSPVSEKIYAALQPCLANLIALGLVTKQLHWNVVGPNFRPIHLFLDEIYEGLLDFTDQIAERMSAVGRSPNGRLADVLKSAEVTDVPEGFLRDVDVLALASDRLCLAARSIRGECDKLEDTDPSTADILHAAIDKLETYHWMIQAQRI